MACLCRRFLVQLLPVLFHSFGGTCCCVRRVFSIVFQADGPPRLISEHLSNKPAPVGDHLDLEIPKQDWRDLALHLLCDQWLGRFAEPAGAIQSLRQNASSNGRLSPDCPAKLLPLADLQPLTRASVKVREPHAPRHIGLVLDRPNQDCPIYAPHAAENQHVAPVAKPDLGT